MDFVEDFRGIISREAEQLVSEIFPTKAAELDALLQNESFRLGNLTTVQSESCDSVSAVTHSGRNTSRTDEEEDEPPAKLRKNNSAGEGMRNGLQTGSAKEIRVNSLIEEMMNSIRPEIISLMEYCNTIRTWVMLLLPKMEDGNNFGVSVQEETMAELKGVEQEAAVFLDRLTSYFVARAKVASKVIKHPRIHDYARFIAEEDEKQFVSLRHTVAELRNFYSSLHDLISKNMDKIKTPRSSNHGSMY